MTYHSINRLRIFLLIPVLLASLLCSSQQFSEQGVRLDWAINFGGSGASGGLIPPVMPLPPEGARAIQVDSSGNSYVTGFFVDSTDFDPSDSIFRLTALGEKDVFIAKYDSLGNFIWARQIAAESESVSPLVKIQGNIFYLVASFDVPMDFDFSDSVALSYSVGNQNVPFIAKYNLEGDFQWVKTFLHPLHGAINAIDTRPDESFLLCGYFSDSLYLNPASDTLIFIGSSYQNDLFVAEYDLSGEFTGGFALGGSAADVCTDIKAGVSNSFLITGYVSDSLDSDPGPLINETNASEFGNTFVAKFNTISDFDWLNLISSTGHNRASSISRDTAGNIFVTGLFYSATDFDPSASDSILFPAQNANIFFAKYGEDGTFSWVRQIGGLNFISGSGDYVEVSEDGSVYLAGKFAGTGDFDPGGAIVNLVSASEFPGSTSSDIFLAQYDSNGNFIWAENIGNASGFTESVFGIYVTSEKKLHVAGSFFWEMDADPNSGEYLLSANGYSDAMLNRYSPCYHSYSELIINDCNFYVAPSGKSLTSAGVYQDTIPNRAGCDSVIIIYLTLRHTYSELNVTECSSVYTSPSGASFIYEGVYSDTLTNAAGCDSIISIGLSFGSDTSIINIVNCIDYTAPDGTVYSTSGLKKAVINGYDGCDSTIFINLSIIPVELNVVQSADSLIANASNAEYQWLDCNNSYSIIEGEIYRYFSTFADGNYAVEIVQNSCKDTSECIDFVALGFRNMNVAPEIVIYPNPVGDFANINFGKTLSSVSLTLFEITGKQLSIEQLNSVNKTTLTIPFSPGIYLLRIDDGITVRNIKIVKQ